MLLIADGGSSKIDWAIINKKTHEVVDRFSSPGVNPVTMQPDVLNQIFTTYVKPQIADLLPSINNVEYFGAGCLGNGAERMKEALIKLSGCKHVKVDSDLEGACRGLCGNRPGIVVILGTGSNSALWNGNKITEHTPSLGYVLGDEGSGAALGKALINAVFKHQLDENICESYMQWVGMSEADIITRVYRQPQANKFLAQQAPFLANNIHLHPIHTIVMNEFTHFIRLNILNYTGFPELPVMATGGIVKNFSSVWFDALDNFDIAVHDILDNPIEGLINYALT